MLNSKVSVIVVNWNAGIQLKACIESILENGAGLVQEIIVVDNGSIDGSDSYAENPPSINLIRSNTNLGFGRACNIGAADASSDYLLFLNPDAKLYAQTLPTALAYMEDSINSSVGICGVQLVNSDGEVSHSCTRFPTAFAFMAHSVGLDRAFPLLGHFMTEWDHGQTRHVDHVIGACYMVRRGIFENLGGFDERFFVYLEDLDFSLRAHQAGWTSVYLTQTQAFHAGGGTSNQVRARRLFYSQRSRLQYA